MRDLSDINGIEGVSSRVEEGVPGGRLGSVVGVGTCGAEARVDFLLLELEVGVVEHVGVVKIVLIDGHCHRGRRLHHDWRIQIVLSG